MARQGRAGPALAIAAIGSFAAGTFGTLLIAVAGPSLADLALNFGAPESVPAKFAGRRFYPHNPAVTLMRTTAEENGRLGEILADKLNAATGPVTLMLPLRGVSMIDVLVLVPDELRLAT